MLSPGHRGDQSTTILTQWAKSLSSISLLPSPASAALDCVEAPGCGAVARQGSCPKKSWEGGLERQRGPRQLQRLRSPRKATPMETRNQTLASCCKTAGRSRHRLKQHFQEVRKLSPAGKLLGGPLKHGWCDGEEAASSGTKHVAELVSLRSKFSSVLCLRPSYAIMTPEPQPASGSHSPGHTEAVSPSRKAQGSAASG